MTAYSHEQKCAKCKKTIKNNRYGMCQACRRQKCSRCGGSVAAIVSRSLCGKCKNGRVNRDFQGGALYA